MGDNLKVMSSLKDIQLKFILVVKNAADVAWLAEHEQNWKIDCLK